MTVKATSVIDYIVQRLADDGITHCFGVPGDYAFPFETVDGRETWHTPWGDPAEVRSIAVDLDGAIYVNVHVGGIVRSRDAGRSWTPIVDIAADVHQVIAHPRRAGIVLAAAAQGFGISRDTGDSWRFITGALGVTVRRFTTSCLTATCRSYGARGCRGSRATL